RSSLRSAGSRSARAFTVSVKFLVSAIVLFLLVFFFLALPVVLPAFCSNFDVLFLPLFCSSRKQNQYGITVFPKINSVPRSIVNYTLQNSSAYAFHVGPVSQTQPHSGCIDLDRRLCIKAIEPFLERAMPGLI